MIEYKVGEAKMNNNNIVETSNAKNMNKAIMKDINSGIAPEHVAKVRDQIAAIVEKNLKTKLRNPQTYIFTIGIPVIFTIMLFFIFGTIEIIPGWRIYDVCISGMLIYAASLGATNAATILTDEKSKGTLKRLDTTGVKRSTIFLSMVISESILMAIQILIIFVIGYGMLGLRWHEYNPLLLVIGYLIILFFGISTLGIGVIISAYAKAADSANGITMMYTMPILYMSGVFTPFESAIQYFTPPFWANALYKQLVVFGHNFWTDFVQVSSADPFVAEYLPIPLWGAFLIVLGILAVVLFIGIKLFQKKTNLE